MIHKRSTASEQSIKKIEGLNMFNGTKLTLSPDVEQDNIRK